MLDFWNHIPYPNLISGILALFVSALVCAIFTPIVVRIAKAKGLVDKPNERTSHNGAVPLLGGVAIFAGIIMATSLFVPAESVEKFRFLLAAVVILFFVGQKDDVVGISWKNKLVAQILSACILVFLADIRITTLHGFLGVHEISYWLGSILSIFIYLLINQCI